MLCLAVRQHARRLAWMTSTTAIAIALTAGRSLPAYAQAVAVEEEIVVTGSRIVREGYEAPTPLTVFGAEQLQNSASSSLIDTLTQIPAVIGASTPTSGATGLSPGTAGLQTMNLRSLGANRVLVLFDGQRMVGSSLGGDVNTGSIPAQLIQRVDIVTGGASAVYGSDAVSGVVNFVLDRNYTGVKGEVSGGITNYGDAKNYRASLTSGFGFAGGRGHILMSGEFWQNQGTDGDGGRGWSRAGFQQITNPAYTATNGQPRRLYLNSVGLQVALPGGIIVSGPLKGTAFGAGGAPYQYQYGLFASPYNVGGDWQIGDTRPLVDLAPPQKNANFYSRVSFDVSDNLTAFAQWNWIQDRLISSLIPPWIFGGPAGPQIRSDNAFIPASVRTAMQASGLTSFALGVGNGDIPSIGGITQRMTNRINAGLEGEFDAFGTAWTWDANFVYGATKIWFRGPSAPLRFRYNQAIDAVVNPANGQIVCRSSLTDPNNGCKPWNPMGLGVNSDLTRLDWMNNDGEGSWQNGLVQQTVYSTSIAGEPFELWAGPVSLALSAEHRVDKVNAVTDVWSLTGEHILGNLPSLPRSKQSVTEGAIETVIPIAKNVDWAQAWDLNAAVRATDYEVSGYVTTWKLGTTYTPVDDLTIRVTRSRDIRAPNLYELYRPDSFGAANQIIVDPFLGNPPPSYPLTNKSITKGNPDLVAEKADTIGAGIVLRPGFLTGFTASVDYWDVKIKGAIQPISVQQVIDTCFTGQFPQNCANVIRNSAGAIDSVRTYGINLAEQHVRGLDLEASYRAPLSDLISDWAGNLSVHGLMTFYLRNYEDNTFTPPTNRVGQNSGGVPDWKLQVNASYSIEPVTISLTGRANSNGVFDTTYIECTTGCPTATNNADTVNTNQLPGRFYVDANVGYDFEIGETTGQFFVSARNLFNVDPPPLAGAYFGNAAAGGTLYDPLGTVYRAGFRFRM
jgi:iron complex outermembrane receptor protein